MNQITRPSSRMVLFPPLHPLAAISAQLEDLPPPLCAWAQITLRTATSPDHVLLVADGATEAAKEAESILRGCKDAAAYRLMASLLRDAAPIIEANRKETRNDMA